MPTHNNEPVKNYNNDDPNYHEIKNESLFIEEDTRKEENIINLNK